MGFHHVKSPCHSDNKKATILRTSRIPPKEAGEHSNLQFSFNKIDEFFFFLKLWAGRSTQFLERLPSLLPWCCDKHCEQMQTCLGTGLCELRACVSSWVTVRHRAKPRQKPGDRN